MELVRNLLLPDRIVWSVCSFSIFAPLLYCYLITYLIFVCFSLFFFALPSHSFLLFFLGGVVVFSNQPVLPGSYWRMIVV